MGLLAFPMAEKQRMSRGNDPDGAMAESFQCVGFDGLYGLGSIGTTVLNSEGKLNIFFLPVKIAVVTGWLQPSIKNILTVT